MAGYVLEIELVDPTDELDELEEIKDGSLSLKPEQLDGEDDTITEIGKISVSGGQAEKFKALFCPVQFKMPVRLQKDISKKAVGYLQ